MMADVLRNADGAPFSKWKPEEKFAAIWALEAPDGSEPVREYRFHPTRQWRWDFAWPQFRIAVEIDGFGFGHQSLTGIARGHEKQNAGVELGWRVLRFTSRNLGSRQAVSDAIQQVLQVITVATEGVPPTERTDGHFSEMG